MYCWMNDVFMKQDELRISPFDHGFLYGLGFFETFRTYNGEIPFLKEHYSRLLHSLGEYRIDLPITMDELEEIVRELVALNGGEDGYFRVNVSAGVHEIGLAPTQYDEPNVIVFQKPLIVSPRGTEKSARWLHTRRNTPEGTLRSKSHSYGNNVLARFEMPSLAAEEGLFLTEEGIVAEGITSNVFWVKRGCLYTPSLQTGILNGITRQQILLLAKQLGFTIYEGEFYAQDIELAEELFITNAVQELVPIKQLGNKKYLGAKGQLYKRLHQAYYYTIEQKVKECQKK